MNDTVACAMVKLVKGWRRGRTDPLEDQMDVRGRRRRGPDWRGLADSLVVLVARVICVVAGLAALGIGLVGMLAGTGLGPWGTGIGAVLLLLGLPWRWLSLAFVATMVIALVLVGVAA